MSGRWRIGIDVGGTFNDLVAIHEDTGARVAFKEPSVPADPALAVRRGLEGLMARARLGPGDIGRVLHGTTLALNAILQRRGARLAMVVSRGNRDVFEIARAQVPMALDFTAPREVPLIPASRVFEVGARVQADGTVVEAPEAAELDALADRLQAAGAEAVVVLLLNAYRHPALERQVAAELARRLPGMPITESAAIWPEVREYERGLVAALNAFVQPLMEGYFDRLAGHLAALGIAAPVFITTNSGGTVSLATARARPVETVLSGPASGVISALRSVPAAMGNRLVTFDMGGTSADMAVIDGGEPEITDRAQLGEFPLILPVVALDAIGAGGGSVVWCDAQGVLKVGPESTGADPGPACYGRGGTQATLTDCYLALGLLDPDDFLGGRMRLEPGPALAALDALGAQLGLPADDRPQRAAEAAVRVASAMMGVEAGKLLAGRGLDPRAFALVTYGGAGATHGCLLGAEAGLGRVIVPATPGTFCALGAALADVRRDFTAPLAVTLSPAGDGFAPAAEALARLGAQARGWAAAEAGGAAPRLRAMVRMRFPDQAYALEIFVEHDELPALDGPGLLARYHDRHAALYGFADRAAPVWLGALRLTVAVPTTLPPPPGAPSAPQNRQARAARQVWHDGGWHRADCRDRGTLTGGPPAGGPLLIAGEDTTIWVPPGWTAHASPDGTLEMRRTRPVC